VQFILKVKNINDSVSSLRLILRKLKKHAENCTRNLQRLLIGQVYAQFSRVPFYWLKAGRLALDSGKEEGPSR
jgi:hypothetical protein